MSIHRLARLAAALAALLVAGLVLGLVAAPSHGSPAVAPAALPTTLRFPVPAYSVAVHDQPITYSNGCHAKRAVVVAKPCTFGVANGSRTVLLFGDSHAAHWHAAVLYAANLHRWRMLTLTKSGCPSVSVAVRRYKTPYPYPQCQQWRSSVFAGLAAHRFGRVDVVVMSSWHFHQVLTSATSKGKLLGGVARTRAWEAGARATFAALLRGAKQVVVLRDSPDMPGDDVVAQACYRRYGVASQRHCGGPVATTLSAALWGAERRAAAAFPGRVVTVDLSTPTCPHGWCGPVDGPYLRFKDDNHWTQTYMRVHFARPVNVVLAAAMARAG